MALTAKDYVCGSCAGGEISGLSTHKDGKEAMLRFCETVLGLPGAARSGSYLSTNNSKKFGTTASHYVFIAGPEETATTWKNYGSEFEKFILENGLGLVATLPPTKNRKYHPATNCKIWVWQPNQDALEKWWEDNGVSGFQNYTNFHSGPQPITGKEYRIVAVDPTNWILVPNEPLEEKPADVDPVADRVNHRLKRPIKGRKVA